MTITRSSLFESDALQIGLFEAHGVPDTCGDIEQQSLHVVVLPYCGVFSKHDAPGQHVIGSPSHAVFFAANAPSASQGPRLEAHLRSSITVGGCKL